MNDTIKQEDIDTAIKECFWRKDVGGVSICSGMLAPCSRVIEKCQCDTLINLYREREDGEHETTD